ncbi:AAA family ATPase [Nevskia ramosa]|uniref:AAA family ATPase n=1 Tax=Nevskia ramosa TaxID=64002 RepID=UPI0023543825|nr:AAA family ATPase [Nevskia ramosa]
MRIERLLAERYGKFEGFALDLPTPKDGAPDLHLVVGSNEAGKSTLRRAILELFYGFPTQKHAMSYRHGSETTVAAEISNGSDRFVWRRTRARKNPLVDAAGVAVPATVQAQILGATGREEFEAMYCLDHDGLREGGQSILKGESDLGRMLFEAATGLRQLGAVQVSIDEACNKLIARHGATRTRFKELAAAAKAAEDNRKAAEVLAPEYRRRVDERERAQVALREAKKALSAAQAEQGRLQLFSALLPLLAVYRDHEARLREVPAGRDLPADASTRLSAYEQDRSDHTRLVDEAKSELAERQSAFSQCPERDPVLDLAGEISAIAGKSDDPRNDRDRLQGELQNLVATVRGLAAGLGFPEMSASQLREVVPSYATRIALQQALNDLNNARTREQNSLEQHAKAEKALKDALLTLKEHPLATVSQELMAVLDHAATIPGAADVELADRQARSALDAAMLGLEPWRGVVDRLRALVPPTSESLSNWGERDAAQTKALNEAKAELRQADARIKSANSDLQLLPDAAETGRHDVLSRERAARDAAWKAIKSGGTTVQAGSNTLETHIGASDWEADALIAHADFAARRAGLEREIAGATADARAARGMVTQIDATIAALKSEIAEACRQMGLPELERPALRNWLERRDAALAKADDARAKSVSLAARKEQIANGVSAATAALVSEGRDPSRLSGLDLPALLRLGKSQIEEQRTAEERHRTAAKDVREAQAKFDGLITDHEAATSEAANRETEWVKALSDAALPAQVTAATLLPLLPRFDDLEKQLNEITGIENRLAEIGDFLGKQEDRWRALAGRAGIDVDGLSPQQMESTLRLRLLLATEAEQSRRQAEVALADANKALDKAISAAQRGADAIKPLLEQTGTDDLAEAITLAAHSDRRRECRSSLQTAGEAVLHAAGGRSLEQISADLAGRTPEDVESAKRGIDADLPSLDSARDAAQTAAEAAERAVGEVAGSGIAAEAAGQRLQVHSQMADVVRQYLRLKAASAVIRRTLQVYREEKQGPVVALASRYFSELTNGAFERLALDEEGLETTFVSIRAGGPPESRKVGLDGLSDGSRDQLYLALRLAGIELQIRDNQRCVPVVCDDLFVHFDDDRAGAAFKSLAGLGTSTQVIYFTHHPHLTDVATKANRGWKIHQIAL